MQIINLSKNILHFAERLKFHSYTGMLPHNEDPVIPSSSNKNTPISQLARLHLAQRLREALLAELESLDRRHDMVVGGESEHVIVSSAGGDKARFEVIAVHEERKGSVLLMLEIVSWNGIQ